ncbi:NlpC/P60 family protein [Nocardia sp. NPDC057353]|uniref:NlpC/P60 family protein n=1 Tax=Nocardia sp. NPDC057353 TaxID=3346104 RepID=UPI0036261FA2
MQRRRLRVAVGLLIAAVLLVGTGQALAVPPPPPNPSDQDIARAGAQVDSGVTEVSGLVNEVAAADQQLQVLDDAVARTREEVNKALVDLQNARDAADAAAAHVTETVQSLTAAGEQVERARGDFDDFATEAYTRPGAGAMVSYLSAATPDAALDRAQVLDLVSKRQQSVLDGLRRAQLDQGNRNAEAREAKSIADAAAADAEVKKDAAQNAVTAATAELDRQTVQRNVLQQARDAAQGRLDAARSAVSGLQDQRAVWIDWDRQRRAEEAAILAAAAAAAARAAVDQAARDRAATLNQGSRPHTQLEATPSKPSKPKKPKPSSPSVHGSAAVETVVDRAMSQLGVTYAWGGGDEDGPTLGIKDGGVADQHGDYKKVGFDCSGLMLYAFAGIGVALPHYSGYQYNAGTRVPVEQRRRGDMLFWGAGGSQHVALYLGDGTMIEAPQSGDVVKVSPVRTSGIMPYAVRIVTG